MSLNDNNTTNNELQRDLGRVEGKIDGILVAVTGMTTSHTLLDARVTKVENKQYWFAGLAAAAGFVAAKFSAFLLH